MRLGLVHHVTWSINSICHAIGERPFASRDRAGNVAWLAVLSMGESWHNLHHADPTCARHGVLPGQFDSSARIIRWFEQLGWASDVRWPKPARLAAKRAPERTGPARARSIPSPVRRPCSPQGTCAKTRTVELSVAPNPQTTDATPRRLVRDNAAAR